MYSDIETANITRLHRYVTLTLVMGKGVMLKLHICGKKDIKVY